MYPFIILLCVSYALDRNGSAFSYITAVCIHELGHFCAIILSGGRIKGISQMAFGGSISYMRNGLSKNAEAFVYASGAFFGAILWLVCKSLGFFAVADASAALTLLNILPAYPLDGGYILENLLPFDNSRKITVFVSFICGAILCVLGTVLIIQKGSFSLFSAGITIFVCLLSKKGV